MHLCDIIWSFLFSISTLGDAIWICKLDRNEIWRTNFGRFWKRSPNLERRSQSSDAGCLRKKFIWSDDPHKSSFRLAILRRCVRYHLVKLELKSIEFVSISVVKAWPFESKLNHTWSVWPDWAKFRHSGKNLKDFENLLRVNLFLGKMFNLHWQFMLWA